MKTPEEIEKWQEGTRATFEKVRKHEYVYNTEINGLEILVYPEVFSPHYFTDTAWFAREIPKIVGTKRLLEIGSGTGAIAVAAELNGADVVASDVTRQAYINTVVNFLKHSPAARGISWRGEHARVFYGDIYNSMTEDCQMLDEQEPFDVIFWNHPFNRAEEPVEDLLLRAGWDYQYESLTKYIAEAKDLLKPGGKLLLGSSNYADIQEIERIAREHGYPNIKLLKSKKFPMEPESQDITEYRLYHLKDVT